MKKLTAAQVYRTCDPESLAFDTTAALEPLDGILGQPRAIAALEVGVGMRHEGYHVFALGVRGAGQREVIERFLRERAKSEPVPDDWCYVYNFQDRNKPRALRLPAGAGVRLRRDLDRLTAELQAALSSSFESEEYQTSRQAIEEEFKTQTESAFAELEQEAKEHKLVVLKTPVGIAFAPSRDDKVLSPEEFQKLSEEERKEVEANVKLLQQAAQKIFERGPKMARERQQKLRELNREVTTHAVSDLLRELREDWAGIGAVSNLLTAIEEDVVEHAAEILSLEQAQLPFVLASTDSPLSRYKVNVLVDRSESEGAPVVYEENPTYNNLIGRVEHFAREGVLATDFNLIKPGVLHGANGGYLMLDVQRLLMQPFAWDGLKRALQAQHLRISSPAESLSLVTTISLEPEPVPLDLKVVLVGEPLLYYLLCAYDPDFGDLFKVAADFAEEMPRDEGGERMYSQLIASLARESELLPFDRGAVARVIEEGSRKMSDATKLSLKLKDVDDLLAEASYCAGEAQRQVVTRADVQKAIDQSIFRSDRLRERSLELIERGTVLIDTEGEKVGQINGLSVLQLGDFSFGRPSRISGRVRMGKGELINIEREVELSGPIHSKGVLILAGFLGGRYAERVPLSIAASLVFEQSYAGVDGDSASSAELYVLLSAIGQIPLRQSLAVTGSVNQYGEIQPIGGANEKIEGFFDVCRARGLTGEQGVLIPAGNVEHLMLRQEVVDAIAEERFSVYPVTTIDEGIELLTGLEAGEPGEDGEYPTGSVNARVLARLEEFAERARAFSRPPSKEKNKDESKAESSPTEEPDGDS